MPPGHPESESDIHCLAPRFDQPTATSSAVGVVWFLETVSSIRDQFSHIWIISLHGHVSCFVRILLCHSASYVRTGSGQCCKAPRAELPFARRSHCRTTAGGQGNTWLFSHRKTLNDIDARGTGVTGHSIRMSLRLRCRPSFGKDSSNGTPK